MGQKQCMVTQAVDQHGNNKGKKFVNGVALCQTRGGEGGILFIRLFYKLVLVPTIARLLAKLAIAANQDGDDEEDEESNQPAAHLWLLLFLFYW